MRVLRVPALLAIVTAPLVVVPTLPAASPGSAIDAALRPALDRIQHDVSGAEMRKMLDAFSKLTRISGSPAEAEAADFLEAALKRYGISYVLDGFSREFARDLTGLAPAREPNPLFRPGRDSDASFQGIGVPEFFIGTGGLPADSPDRMPGGGVWYWHTPEDTADKLDMNVLVRDTQLRVAELLTLGTRAVLPVRIAPIAREYVAALDALARDAGSASDLGPTRDRAKLVAAAAERLDAAVQSAPASAAERANRLLRDLSHRLDSTLYTYSGRFDQDRAGSDPLLPLLAGVRDLASLDPQSDEYGFLQTALLRGRNAVDATLDDSLERIEGYLGRPGGRRLPRNPRASPVKAAPRPGA